MNSQAAFRTFAILALIPMLTLAVLQLSTGVSYGVVGGCTTEQIEECSGEFRDCDDSCEECEEAFQECIEACGSNPGQGNQCV